ncbi:hypothetical protein B484DRAFT_456796 [Ochromonadaceae sp. CCMP2298]|nr:hypothetical protein B484DRAFT_456796 [Ochromonadaceae sp. CCMP2298]
MWGGSSASRARISSPAAARTARSGESKRQDTSAEATEGGAEVEVEVDGAGAEASSAPTAAASVSAAARRHEGTHRRASAASTAPPSPSTPPATAWPTDSKHSICTSLPAPVPAPAPAPEGSAAAASCANSAGVYKKYASDSSAVHTADASFTPTLIKRSSRCRASTASAPAAFLASLTRAQRAEARAAV